MSCMKLINDTSLPVFVLSVTVTVVTVLQAVHHAVGISFVGETVDNHCFVVGHKLYSFIM